MHTSGGRTDWDAWGDDLIGRRAAPTVPEHPATVGDVVEHTSGWVGAVVGIEAGLVQLEDRRGTVRGFPLGAGFMVDGRPVRLIKPVAAPKGASATRSGSRSVADERARTALPSRIFVEGLHDAELVEHVWGADLRHEGVAVEPLHGADDLAQIVGEFAPSRDRRLGVLLDHLVTGSKESRIAHEVARGPFAEHVLVVGHPFVDIWQAVKPARVGLEAWPEIPRNEDWKRGQLRRLGLPHASPEDVALGWKRIRGRVRDWNDLEPALIGKVESLIDFVTAGR